MKSKTPVAIQTLLGDIRVGKYPYSEGCVVFYSKYRVKSVLVRMFRNKCREYGAVQRCHRLILHWWKRAIEADHLDRQWQLVHLHSGLTEKLQERLDASGAECIALKAQIEALKIQLVAAVATVNSLLPTSPTCDSYQLDSIYGVNK